MTFEEWQEESPEHYAAYSRKIKEYRAKRKLTQREFAKKAGISYSTVQALENCKRYVTYVTISIVNHALEN